MANTYKSVIRLCPYETITLTVEPGRCWFTVKSPEDIQGPVVFKIELDRPYPYILVGSLMAYHDFGLALTIEDVQHAAIFDPDKEKIVGFDMEADGILFSSGFAARCIAAGARRTFYIIPAFSGPLNELGLIVSAQDIPECPFARTTGRW